MPEEDKIVTKIGKLTGKIDKSALATAIGLMILSWGALPIVYWLIVHRSKNDTKNKIHKMEEMRNKSKETEKS